MLASPGLWQRAPPPSAQPSVMIKRASVTRVLAQASRASAAVQEALTAQPVSWEASQLHTRRQSGAEATVSGQAEAAAGVELIYGPMFAGKTTHLVKQLSAWKAKGRYDRLLVAKSNLDDRYNSLRDGHSHGQLQRGYITTHGGERHECFAVARLKDLLQHKEYEQAEMICIDEAHFLPDLVEFCTEAAKTKRVLVAGLDLDFRKQPFGKVLALQEALQQHVLTVHQLEAACAVCGKAAQFTQRTVDCQSQVLVGSKDIYQPVCAAHHTS